MATLPPPEDHCDLELRRDLAATSLRIEARLRTLEAHLAELFDSRSEIWAALEELDTMSVGELRDRVDELERRRRWAA